MREKFQKIINNKIFLYICLIIPYLIMDLLIRYYAIKSSYFYSIRNISPILFSLSIIIFNLLIINLLNKKGRIIYQIFTYITTGIIALVHYFHHKILGTFFTFSELFLAGEGMTFVNSIFSYTNFSIIIIIIFMIFILIISVILLKKIDIEIDKKKSLIIFAVLIVFCQLGGIFFLYINDNGYYKTDINSPLYNYNNFEIPTKSIQVTGLLQYTIQDVIYYYREQIKNELNEMEYKKEVYTYLKSRKILDKTNEYSEIFKDKNLIYIMLESGDDWLITEENMPTLYKMQQSGWNFTNRYSPFFYSGYTFNAEFAANTGIYLSDNFEPFVKNEFPYSLANMFKNNGYIVNSFHMNKGDFYSRNLFHKQFGYTKHYDNYYRDEKTIKKGYNYLYDVEWIRNPETYKLIAPKNKKFMSFIITYSMHLPYINNGICDEAINEGKIKFKIWEEREPSCINYLAKQSDDMFRMLLKKLEEDKLLDETIIIVFSDHNAYGLSDKNYLAKKKNTNNFNLQQKTPLIIWGNNIEHKEIKTLMDTADLVPTIANLFGLDWNPNNYLSTDVFSSYHDQYIYFQYGDKLNNNNEYITSSSGDEAYNMIKYNKYILQTDYYK